jgi:hypothetical protein
LVPVKGQARTSARWAAPFPWRLKAPAPSEHFCGGRALPIGTYPLNNLHCPWGNLAGLRVNTVVEVEANDTVLLSDGEADAIKVPKMVRIERFLKCGVGLGISTARSVATLVGVERWLVPTASIVIPEISPDEPLIEGLQVGGNRF